MNVGQMIDRTRDFISEYVDENDVNEENVYFKTDHILRTLNEAQEIVQQKLFEYDVKFLAKEDTFTLQDGEKEKFIEDMFIPFYVEQTNPTGNNPIELFSYDITQKENQPQDYYMFGNKIAFTNFSGIRYYKIKYYKKATQLEAKMDISEIPIGFHHVLTKYAATMLLGLDEAFDLAGFFDNKYKESVQEMNNVSINRQHQTPRFVHPARDRIEAFMY